MMASLRIEYQNVSDTSGLPAVDTDCTSCVKHKQDKSKVQNKVELSGTPSIKVHKCCGALLSSEHYSEEYTKINRFQKVPVIDHNGFVLSESVAILKYLSREGIIPDSLYPKESKQAARVEQFLEWQHAGLRLHCAMYFRVKALDPIITGKVPDPKTLQGYERRMESALGAFNDLWLGRGHPFVAGERISVADLLAACEVEQPRMAGYDPIAKYPNIAEWMRRVREHFAPYYDEGHVIVNKIIKNKSKLESKL